MTNGQRHRTEGEHNREAGERSVARVECGSRFISPVKKELSQTQTPRFQVSGPVPSKYRARKKYRTLCSRGSAWVLDAFAPVPPLTSARTRAPSSAFVSAFNLQQTFRHKRRASSKPPRARRDFSSEKEHLLGTSRCPKICSTMRSSSSSCRGPSTCQVRYAAVVNGCSTMDVRSHVFLASNPYPANE